MTFVSSVATVDSAVATAVDASVSGPCAGATEVSVGITSDDALDVFVLVVPVPPKSCGVSSTAVAVDELSIP